MPTAGNVLKNVSGNIFTKGAPQAQQVPQPGGVRGNIPIGRNKGKPNKLQVRRKALALAFGAKGR
jgi:hypothetical protein